MTGTRAEHEKNRVALTSVVAALFLTGFKVVTGLMTGSMGILAEAAHSALDLIAAVITLFAVRFSGRPADLEHTYGHGKIENLSALFETFLLFLTCVWIIYESVKRLLFVDVHVQVSIWAFVVVILSVIIDFGRSRALARTAKKYNSQALEADALHFSTDIWSSLVVLMGLILVLIAKRTGIAWLVKADAAAALIVAGIVIHVSLQLGKRTVSALLDAIPSDLISEISRAIMVPGVLRAGRVRARRSGADAFADITVMVARDTSLEQAHDIATAVEERVHRIMPGSDVMVHLDPVESGDESMLQVIRLTAARHGLGVHGIRIYNIHGREYMEQHIEVNENYSLEEAHAQSTRFEEALHRLYPGLDQIITHIEPVGESSSRRQPGQADPEQIRHIILELPEVREAGVDIHDLMVNSIGGEVNLAFHYALASDLPITDAHLLTEKIEQALRHRIPHLGRVVIHTEPRQPRGEE
ncbi:MAG TPA: cation-efflux pump [bacterium]|nr:cation-efflux pump [bacterium]